MVQTIKVPTDIPLFLQSNRMAMRSLLILLLCLAACGQKTSQQTPTTADTTQVIELALRSALGQDFPELDAVKRKHRLSDSIFFTTNLFSLSNLPSKVDSFVFKVMPDTAICTVIKADTTVVTEQLPNYLRLQSFQQTDTGYFVQFESVICVPKAQKDASVGLHILKTKDKFVFEKK